MEVKAAVNRVNNSKPSASPTHCKTCWASRINPTRLSTGMAAEWQPGQDVPRSGWGLPDSKESSVPVSRPVVVECWPDRLVIHGDDARTITKQIPMTQHTEDSVDELVSSVWQQMKGWGPAGRSSYWKPVLSMHVAPGAEPRYDELQTLLTDSGLGIKNTNKVPTAAKPANPLRKSFAGNSFLSSRYRHETTARTR